MSSFYDAVNYRALLVKYMRCCIECDGYTHLMHEYPEGLMSPEEIAELEALSKEAKG